MQQSKLLMTTSPHQFAYENTRAIMLEVLMALVPAATLGIFFFGLDALWLILVGVGASMATEAVINKLTGRPFTVLDLSACVTGLLLAFTVPASLPLWILAIGAVVAIGIGKLVFGGLGNNPFNPALVGRAVLLASWPTQMTTWVAPFTFLTAATPLGGGIKPAYSSLFLGAIPGSLGETSALALLLGGLYLIWRGIIDWRIPAGFVGTVAAFTLIFGGDPLFHVLSGGLLLGAFFMATDMVTSPVTKTGRLVMGIGCGLLTSVIRLWGGYPEGVCYSILIMNALTPLIDRYVRPKRFGGTAL